MLLLYCWVVKLLQLWSDATTTMVERVAVATLPSFTTSTAKLMRYSVNFSAARTHSRHFSATKTHFRNFLATKIHLKRSLPIQVNSSSVCLFTSAVVWDWIFLEGAWELGVYLSVENIVWTSISLYKNYEVLTNYWVGWACRSQPGIARLELPSSSGHRQKKQISIKCINEFNQFQIISLTMWAISTCGPTVHQ